MDPGEWGYSVGPGFSSQCLGRRPPGEPQQEADGRDSGGQGAHSSPGNLPRTMQMPSPGLWEPPHDEGQEHGWQGELKEEKGAVSEASSALGPPRRRAQGTLFPALVCRCSMRNYRTDNYRGCKKASISCVFPRLLFLSRRNKESQMVKQRPQEGNRLA